MIDIEKLRQAKYQVMLGQINQAARSLLASGAFGVELSLEGIELAIQKTEGGTMIESSYKQVNSFQHTPGCKHCRGL